MVWTYKDIVAMTKNISLLGVIKLFYHINVCNGADFDRRVFGKVYGLCQETNSGIILMTLTVNSVIMFNIHGMVTMITTTTPMIFGIKLSVISLICVVA